MLINQENRDERIIRLAGTMNDAFSFVDDVEPMNQIEKHAHTITLLIRQVTECGYFITEYAKQKNFCSLPLVSWYRPLLISVPRASVSEIHIRYRYR